MVGLSDCIIIIIISSLNFNNCKWKSSSINQTYVSHQDKQKKKKKLSKLIRFFKTFIKHTTTEIGLVDINKVSSKPILGVLTRVK